MNDTALTRSDISNAMKGHYECTELEKEIARQQACGLDCEEAILRNEHLKRFFQGIQDQYGPLVNPPRKG